MFENKQVQGYIYYTRFIASYAKEGGNVFNKDEFTGWLRQLGLSDEDVNGIWFLATNGRLELEVNAKLYLQALKEKRSKTIGPYPMNYGKDDGKILYFCELDNGFKIEIVNIRGSHPCAYIMVPDTFIEDHCHDGEIYTYYNWYASVHGGFTYVGFLPRIVPDGYDKDKRELWLGWDYAHCGDYTCFDINKFPPLKYEHMWTTEEIIEEAQEVIDTLEFIPLEEEEEK